MGGDAERGLTYSQGTSGLVLARRRHSSAAASSFSVDPRPPAPTSVMLRFDPANGISPRGDSLRVATGLDYHDAAPVSGRRVGFGDAKMSVTASVRAVD